MIGILLDILVTILAWISLGFLWTAPLYRGGDIWRNMHDLSRHKTQHSSVTFFNTCFCLDLGIASRYLADAGSASLKITESRLSHLKAIKSLELTPPKKKMYLPSESFVSFFFVLFSVELVLEDDQPTKLSGRGPSPFWSWMRTTIALSRRRTYNLGDVDCGEGFLSRILTFNIF
jgi:hypothetical protein